MHSIAPFVQMRRSAANAAVAVALPVIAALLAAQTSAKNDEVFRYGGADREVRLLERARKESAPTVYTLLAPTEPQPLVELFEKSYGLKVEPWHALSDKGVQREITEANGRPQAVEANGPGTQMIAREKLLAELHLPSIADVLQHAIGRIGRGSPTA